MATILVSLVSEQTIPNVLYIRECNNVDEYVFISTEKMDKKNVSQHIMEASGTVNNENSETVIVKEDSLQDIEKQLKKQPFNREDKFLVNLTAGTKIMAIGVYDFFKNLNSEIIYIPIGKSHYYRLYPGAKTSGEPIKYRIGVKDYLTGYGISIKNPKKIHQITYSITDTRSFFDFYINQDNDSLMALNDLRGFRGKKKLMLSDVGKRLRMLLCECPIRKFKETQELRKYEMKYLTGDWFEEYVYLLLKEYLSLDDDAIALGVQIERENVNNEIDIMFTRENRLYVIECKTSIYDSNQEKNILNDTLYKLSALKKDFGLFVKPYLFTLSQEGDKINRSHTDRSDLFGITMVDSEVICDPAKIEGLVKSM